MVYKGKSNLKKKSPVKMDDNYGYPHVFLKQVYFGNPSIDMCFIHIYISNPSIDMCSMCLYIYIYLVLSLVINFENPIVIDVSSGNILINLTYKRWALLLGNATRWGKWVCKVITYRFAHD